MRSKPRPPDNSYKLFIGNTNKYGVAIELNDNESIVTNNGYEIDKLTVNRSIGSM